MANLWVDGFEGYSVNIAQAYPLSDGSVTAGGRGGGQCVNIAKLGPLTIAQGTQDTVGVAKIAPHDVFTFLTAGDFPLLVTVDSLGRVVGTFRPSAGGTNLFTVVPPMRLLGVWRYYECKLTIVNATHLTFELLIDGVTIVASTTYVVPTMSPLTLVSITVGSLSAGLVDDFYVNDDTGGAPDDGYWGDTRMGILHPNGAVTAAWTPSPAVANYLNVDDPTTDDDATFNSSTNVSDKDVFEYEPCGLAVGTIVRTVAIMTSAARASDSGPRTITSHIKHSASEVSGGTHVLSDTFYMEQQRVPLCPSTSAAWTPAQIDAARGGYTLTA